MGRKRKNWISTVRFVCVTCGGGSTYQASPTSGVFNYRSKRDNNVLDRVGKGLCVRCYNQIKQEAK